MTWRGCGLLVALAVPSGLSAQGPLFRGSTDLVLLTVTADDGAGQAVSGLTADDFEVFEDGRPQTIAFFAREPQPISMSILIDSSSSMERKMATAQEGASGFVRRLRPQDEAQIIDFDSRIEILQPLTHDVHALEQAIRRTRPGGSTSLYEAIAVAFNEMSRAAAGWGSDEIRRQAIVVLSDGEDTTSLLDYDGLIVQARRSDVVVYAIAMRDNGPVQRRGFNSSTYVLRNLSESTGGRVFFVDEIEQLRDIYTEIADELANQYMLGFVSTNTARDGSWRQINVRVKTRTGATARTRAGYFAPRATR